jgi:hypothetical protein
METKLLGAALVASMAAGGLAVSADSAGAVGVGGFDLSGRVLVTGDLGDGIPGNADDDVDFSFDSVEVETSRGIFAGLNGTGATVDTLSLPPSPINPNGSVLPLEDFVTLDSGDSFTLTTITPPQFTSVVTPNGNNTTFVQYAFDGIAQTSDGQNLIADGIFTAQYTGGVEDLAGILSNGGLETSFSASFEAVPEPFTMMGAGAAIGFGAFFRKRTAKSKKN